MRYLFLLLALLCVSCGTALPSVKPYKMDVQQGNVVTSKMLLQLRPGMTKSQVRFIMGTPLIQDSFHGNRWDYVYQMREAGKVVEQRRVILDFENDLLKAVRGDVIPAGSEQSKATESEAKTGTRVVAPYQKPEEKSLLSKLKFWEKDEAELAKEAQEKEAKAKAAAEAAAAKQTAEEAAKAKALTAQQATKASDTPVVMPPVDVIEVPAAPSASAPNVEPQSAAPAAAAVQAAPEAPIDAPVPNIGPQNAEPPVAVPDAPIDAPAAAPVKPIGYQPPSGMQFDRTLKSVPEAPEAPAAPAPRAGNKEIPKPKDLPPENSPSFFDRMLEKIGF